MFSVDTRVAVERVQQGQPIRFTGKVTRATETGYEIQPDGWQRSVWAEVEEVVSLAPGPIVQPKVNYKKK